MSGTGHTVKSYEEEMQSLNDNLVMMGSLTENQMADAMAAVIKVDKESVDKIVKNDGKINELRSNGLQIAGDTPFFITDKNGEILVKGIQLIH